MTPGKQHIGQWYKRYVLGSVTLLLAMSFLDRSLIVLFLQPIKEDLSLSDTQLGFLTGIAFGLFYATLGLPIARRADRGNRVTIAAVAIGLWGLTVMSCFFVMNFTQLVFARIAAAVGEAGCMPPTYSLVGDYFRGAAERTRAITVYWLASPISQLVSFMAGGWLFEHFGWRLTFVVIGIPGLLLAILIKTTIAEPRVQARVTQLADQSVPPLAQILKILWQQRSSRHLSIAVILILTLSMGLYPWYAAFMIRSHGMTTGELGAWFGPIFGLSGIAGVALGGYVAARWFADNARSQMRLSAAMTALLAPLFVLFLLLPQRHQSLTALVFLLLMFNFFLGPTFALVQRLVAEEIRATTLSVIMLIANLIGMGSGPQIVGILSDALHPLFGADSLRYAMLAMSSLALWAGWHFWQAGRTVNEDLSMVERSGRQDAVVGAG